MASGYEKTIWNYFKSKLGNEYGVAGLMGNLYAESGLYPDRVQGDVPYSNYSKEYTAQVDAGVISRDDFVYNAPNGGGYGLAQWTYSTRKMALYEMWKSGGYSSIGSIELALDYLYYELKTLFPNTLSILKSATSIRQASDEVLLNFEKPANQGESTQQTRASYGQGYYDEFTGTGGNNDIINSAVEWACAIANDDTHGYDQSSRWGVDYDCSSLVISAYQQAGCPVKTNGASYTGNMINVFQKTGFQVFNYVSGMELIKGDVLWRSGHTEMYIGNGQNVGAHINEKGTATGGQKGDQTGHEISITNFSSSGNWTKVLRLNSTITDDENENGSGNTSTKIKGSLSKVLLYSILADRY